VLVTGAASGIGLATVKAFLKNGATVAINDLPGKKLTEIVSAFKAEGFKVINAAGDVGDPISAVRMVDNAIAAMGGIDSLINNAGWFKFSLLRYQSGSGFIDQRVVEGTRS